MEQHYPPGTQENNNSFESRDIMMEKGKELECTRRAGGGKGLEILRISEEPGVPPKMEQSKIDIAMEYAATLIGLPFRWYDAELDAFIGTDKFWCENSAAPSSEEIKENDKSIVCAGFPNLLRRKCGHSIPGLNGNINGKFKELFKEYPGGTGAWFRYLNQRKRLEKLDMKMKYPKGTLLLAKFKDNETDQGHCAVVYDVLGKNINDQLIIHSSPDMLYADRTKEKNHGSVKVEKFSISNEEWREKKKKSYYTYVCRPENWLEQD